MEVLLKLLMRCYDIDIFSGNFRYKNIGDVVTRYRIFNLSCTLTGSCWYRNRYFLSDSTL